MSKDDFFRTYIWWVVWDWMKLHTGSAEAEADPAIRLQSSTDMTCMRAVCMSVDV